MPDTLAKFSCGACQRSYSWKQELAGKRVKCKCGQPVTVPAAPPQAEPEPEDDGLYDLADAAADAANAVAKLPPKIVESPVATVAAAGPGKISRGGVPLEYRRGPTAREIERDPSRTVVDIKRDLYVPVALIVLGAFAYLGYYAIEYHLSAGAMAATAIGLTIMTVLETILLVGFALVVASPLGVSFGSVGPAILKLAAIVVLCDGVITWVDGIVGKYTGGIGNGGFGFGLIGFPVALALYWGALIYLFSMDPGDSWMVVAVLSVFNTIVRLALTFLLLGFFLSRFGGIAASLPSTGSGSGPAASADPLSDEVDQAAALNLMKEGRKFAADFFRKSESPTIDALYAANSKHVWFMLDRDATGKTHPICIIDELPNDKTHRAKCFDAAKAYCDQNKMFYDPASYQDTGQRYMSIGLPMQ